VNTNNAIDPVTGRCEFDETSGITTDLWVQPTIGGVTGPRWQVLPQDIAQRAGGVSSISFDGGAPQTGAVSYTSPAHSPASTDITDATSTGRALITAANAAAARTTVGATTIGGQIFTAADAPAVRTLLGFIAANITDAGATGRTLLQAATTTAARSTLGLTDAQIQAIVGVLTTGATGGSVPQYDTTKNAFIPSDLTTQFAQIDASGRLVPQARPKYDLDLVVINQGDPVPTDVQTGALVWQRPAVASLIPQLEGSNFLNANGTTLTWTNSDAIAVGDWVGFAVFTSAETTSGTLPTVISSITPGAGAYGTLQSGPESVQSGSTQVDLKYAKCTTAVAAGTTHTMTLNQARVHRIAIMFKMPNLAATAPIDQSTSNQGGSQTALDLTAGPTGNMALTPQIGISALGWNDGSAPVTRIASGTNGWSLLSSVESDNGGSSRTLAVFYKAYANSSATPLQANAHITASDGSTGAWSFVAASFKGA